MMKRLLVLGAGMVAGPLVRYLLYNLRGRLTVADIDGSRAEALIAGHPKGQSVVVDANRADPYDALIAEHDLVVSLLPAWLHVAVARKCVSYKRDMVTASYASDEMMALDAAARAAGVMLLNEMGMDPGLDHMSTMRIVDHVRQNGGRILSYTSICGGLPAPESHNNPFGYKFSWNPQGVLLTCKTAATFLEEGRVVQVPGNELLNRHRMVHLPRMGEFEMYPNRDSLKYLELYGLQETRTMLRGTLRYPGWSETIMEMIALGLLDEEPRPCPAAATWSDFVHSLINAQAEGDLRSQLARQLGLKVTSSVLDRWEWLGLFSRERVAGADGTVIPIKALTELMYSKMQYEPGERDMIVMRHEIMAQLASGRDERITSTLIDFGQSHGDTAMAQTVGLPVAIAARLIADGKLHYPGVHIPLESAIYGPVLDELAMLGIRFDEDFEEMI